MATQVQPTTEPPVLTDGPVVDLLGGNLNSVIPPSSDPAAYGAHIRRGGVNVIHVTLGIYARDVEHMLDEFFDAFNLFEQMGDKLMLIERTADLHEAHSSGKLGIILGFQGLDWMRHNTKFVPIFHRLGLRVAALTYNEVNQLGSGCLEPEDNGLTLLGIRILRELRRAGIVLDLSHAGVRTSMEAIEQYDGPVMFTHSNADALTPNPRNLSDDQIKATAATGGVIGLASYAPFCHREDKDHLDVDDYLRHVEYVAELVGSEHVAIGSDITPQSKVKWENATKRMYPDMVGRYVLETEYVEGLHTHAEFPVIPEGLRKRGFSEDDIRGILGGNAIRVCEQIWG